VKVSEQESERAREQANKRVEVWQDIVCK